MQKIITKTDVRQLTLRFFHKFLRVELLSGEEAGVGKRGGRAGSEHIQFLGNRGMQGWGQEKGVSLIYRAGASRPQRKMTTGSGCGAPPTLILTHLTSQPPFMSLRKGGDSLHSV